MWLRKKLEKDRLKEKEQPQDCSLIDSPLVHCPSALELSSPTDSFHLLEDLDEPCTSFMELCGKNKMKEIWALGFSSLTYDEEAYFLSCVCACTCR